jgi:hypothetical protein
MLLLLAHQLAQFQIRMETRPCSMTTRRYGLRSSPSFKAAAKAMTLRQTFSRNCWSYTGLQDDHCKSFGVSICALAVALSGWARSHFAHRPRAVRRRDLVWSDSVFDALTSICTQSPISPRLAAPAAGRNAELPSRLHAASSSPNSTQPGAQARSRRCRTAAGHFGAHASRFESRQRHPHRRRCRRRNSCGFRISRSCLSLTRRSGSWRIMGLWGVLRL